MPKRNRGVRVDVKLCVLDLLVVCSPSVGDLWMSQSRT